MHTSTETIQLLDEKLAQLNKLRPISPSVLSKIREQFEIEMTYNSNAIEGNSLTLKETFWVISEGITIKEKPLKDHLEAKNHKEAMDFLYELIDNSKQNTLSEHLIKELHQIVVRDSQRDIAGKYRDGDVYIAGADHTPPSFLKIPNLMQDLLTWTQKNKKKVHPIELASLLHHRLANIHPFWDGNGRTSRLVMNIIIMQAGYPLAIILKNDRKRYYRVLAQADKENCKDLCEFVAQAVLRSLNTYLKILKPPKDTKKKNISLEEASKLFPYSATYLRKLAVSGKLEAFKESRNWLTTQEAVERYIKNHGKK